jgi:hypothetical protein
VFALNAGQPLDPDALSVYVTLWLEGFADLSDAMLEAAFKKTLATCKFWPVKIADVREHVESAEDSRAEDEWHNLLEYCRKWVNRDTARDDPPPPLPPEIEHAARAAGGVYDLESCSEHDLIFAKQRFIEDLTRQRKTGDIAWFLPCSELRGLLEATAQRFELPPAAAEYFGKPCAQPALPQTKDTRAPREVLQEIAGSGPTYTRCPEHSAEMSALLRQGEEAFKRLRARAETAPETARREKRTVTGTPARRRSARAGRKS